MLSLQDTSAGEAAAAAMPVSRALSAYCHLLIASLLLSELQAQHLKSNGTATDAVKFSVIAAKTEEPAGDGCPGRSGIHALSLRAPRGSSFCCSCHQHSAGVSPAALMSAAAACGGIAVKVCPAATCVRAARARGVRRSCSVSAAAAGGGSVAIKSCTAAASDRGGRASGHHPRCRAANGSENPAGGKRAAAARRWPAASRQRDIRKSAA